MTDAKTTTVNEELLRNLIKFFFRLPLPDSVDQESIKKIVDYSVALIPETYSSRQKRELLQTLTSTNIDPVMLEFVKFILEEEGIGKKLAKEILDGIKSSDLQAANDKELLRNLIKFFYKKSLPSTAKEKEIAIIFKKVVGWVPSRALSSSECKEEIEKKAKEATDTAELEFFKFLLGVDGPGKKLYLEMNEEAQKEHEREYKVLEQDIFALMLKTAQYVYSYDMFELTQFDDYVTDPDQCYTYKLARLYLQLITGEDLDLRDSLAQRLKNVVYLMGALEILNIVIYSPTDNHLTRQNLYINSENAIIALMRAAIELDNKCHGEISQLEEEQKKSGSNLAERCIAILAYQIRRHITEAHVINELNILGLYSQMRYVKNYFEILAERSGSNVLSSSKVQSAKSKRKEKCEAKHDESKKEKEQDISTEVFAFIKCYKRKIIEIRNKDQGATSRESCVEMLANLVRLYRPSLANRLANQEEKKVSADVIMTKCKEVISKLLDATDDSEIKWSISAPSVSSQPSPKLST